MRDSPFSGLRPQAALIPLLSLVWLGGTGLSVAQELQINVAPAVVSVGVSTTVVVTTRPTADVVEQSLQLLVISGTQRAPRFLARMVDDGRNGDVTARDGVFSAQIIVSEPAPTNVLLVVAASLRGVG